MMTFQHLLKISATAVLMSVVTLLTPFAACAAIIGGGFETRGGPAPGGAPYCEDGFSTGESAAPPSGEARIGTGVVRFGGAPAGDTMAADRNHYAFSHGASTLSRTFVANASSKNMLNRFDAIRTTFGGASDYSMSMVGTSETTLRGNVSANGGILTAQSAVRETIVRAMVPGGLR